MSAQRTFAGLAWSDKKKVTRRAPFLAEVNVVSPWGPPAAAITPPYPTTGRGQPSMPLEPILRLFFLHQWFDLSNPAAEDALCDRESMRRFVGVELSDEAVPDGTTNLPVSAVARGAPVDGAALRDGGGPIGVARSPGGPPSKLLSIQRRSIS